MDRVYVPALDGLRAVAVSLVLLAHAGFPYPKSGGGGVDIFFVLSGFLITMILSVELTRFGNLSFRNFYARRALRLVPCLVLTCLFFAVWKRMDTGEWPVKPLAFTLTYTSNWAIGAFDQKLSSLSHTWSLAIEEQFYLIWPIVILVLNRFCTRSLTKGMILLGLAAVVEVYRLEMIGIYTQRRIYMGLDTHMDLLAMGGALFYFVQSLPDRRLSPAASKFVGHFLAPAAMLGMMALMAVLAWTNPWMARVGYVLMGIASSVLILDLVSGSHSLFQQLFSTRPFVFLGRISYGVYLLHLPLFQFIGGYIDPGDSTLIRMSEIVIKIVVSISVAALSYYWIEKPFLSLKARFIRKAPQPAYSPDLAVRELRETSVATDEIVTNN